MWCERAFFLLQWATIMTVVAATRHIRLGSYAVCLIKTFISYLQTISLAQHLDLRWPDAPFGLMLFMEKISTINLQSFPTQFLTEDYYPLPVLRHLASHWVLWV